VFLVGGKLMTMSRNLVVPRSNIHIMKPRKEGRKKERKERKKGKKERQKEIKKNKKSTDIKIVT
jgi:hypothetical protein